MLERQQTRAKKALNAAVIGAFLILFTVSAKPSPQQPPPTLPHWANLPAETTAKLMAEGINAEKYGRLCGDEVVTEQRPVPTGKSGAHYVVFGAVRGNVDKVWALLDNCGKSPPIMPYLQSCSVVQPDHPLPPNRRWELLKINFHMLFFSTKTTLVNEKTLDAPNYLKWNQIRGEAKINEGYFRIIPITPNAQLIVYDSLVDPGPYVPGFVKSWVVKNTLPKVITALREHV